MEGLGVDAIGMNCGLGPNQMIKLLPEYAKYSSTPIIVQPNAGLPMVVNGETLYDIDADEFADYMEKIVELGASVIGGCCGTTTEHIKKMTDSTETQRAFREANILMINSDKSRKELNWRPIISVKEGMKRTEQMYRSYFDGKNIDSLISEELRKYHEELRNRKRG